MDTGSHWKPGWHRVLFLLKLKGRVLADLDGWGFKAIHHFYCGEHRILWMRTHSLRLCNAPAMFQSLMQNCLGELNLTYCLIYLDDMIVFSKTEEEHLHCLHTVFSTLGSTTWSSNQQSVNSSRMRSTTWLITSPRKVYDPAKRT